MESSTFIVNVGLLLRGWSLDVERDVNVEVRDGVIASIGHGFSCERNSITFRHGIAIPALVNAHLHVFDYAFQEAGLELKLPELVSEPHGLKHRLISSLSEEELRRAALEVCSTLSRQGVYLALTFCERLDAVKVLRGASEVTGVRLAALVRPRRLDDGSLSFEGLLDEADGVGLDSPLRYSCEGLKWIKSECSKRSKLVSTHISETSSSRLKGDLELALRCLNPDVVVHATHLDESGIEALEARDIAVVVCPRSNMWFSCGLPPLKLLLEKGVKLLIGTDNAGWVNPDLWRELEAVYNILRLQSSRADPKEVLKMATINIHLVRGLKAPSNVIDEGVEANFVILDGLSMGADSSHNLYSTIVKRGSESRVLCRVYGGRMLN